MHKKLIMACMAIAAFAAFVIAPAASASPVLTENGVRVQATNPDGVNTKIVGTLKAGTNAIFTGSITVTCSKAVLTGELTVNTGTKIAGEIPAGGAVFTGTSGTGTECSSSLFGAATAVTVNSKLCLETITGEDKVKTTGCGGANVTFTLNLTGNGPCTYETPSVTGTFLTGKEATVNLSEQEAKGEATNGAFCPSSGKLDMDFILYTDDNKHETALTIS